jgi:sugar O-acyltransferase (sialic acid O-acetyltransferase NeuD family)
MNRLHIFGAGIRARVTHDLIAWQLADRFVVAGYYDDRQERDSPGPGGAKILGTIEEGVRQMKGQDSWAFLAMGTLGSARACEVLRQLKEAGVRVASLIAPAASVSPSANIGVNAIIPPMAFVGTETVVGDLFTAHGASVVEHHCALGDNVLLGPGVCMGSHVKIGDHCFVGAGTVIAPQSIIGAGTLVGAGSLVRGELPAQVVAFGRPARVVRPTRAGDEVTTKSE